MGTSPSIQMTHAELVAGSPQMLSLFKRVEVILLLALSIGATAWVLLSKPQNDDADWDAPPEEPAVASQEDKIHRCQIERDHGHARLDIELRITNSGTTRLSMQPPQVRLLNEKGAEVPPFFLPFEAQPVLPPGSTQDVRLRYWVTKADLVGPLSLHILEKKIEVKSPEPLDLEKLKNKAPQTFTTTRWIL